MSLVNDLDYGIGIGAITALLERSGIEPAEVGQLHRIKDVRLYQGQAKVDTFNSEGKVVGQHLEVTDLASITLSPKWELGPDWPVVAPARPMVAKPRPAPKMLKSEKTIFIAPDPQIGFRRYSDGTLDPFQDENAINVSLQLIRASKPDQIVNLGDTMDFAEWSSKFLVAQEFMFTTQATLDRTHRYLVEQLTEAPEGCLSDLLEGNHDNRLPIAITRNAVAALRLRAANTPPESWPVLSVQHLLRLDELGVRYHDGYPAGRVRLAPGSNGLSALYAVHGDRLNVADVVKKERQSYVQGHIHRIQDVHATYELDGEAITVNAWSPGCLARVDGAVPSTKGGSSSTGKPIRRVEDWQQGVAVVTVMPDGYWTKEIIPINNGRAIWRGQEFVAS